MTKKIWFVEGKTKFGIFSPPFFLSFFYVYFFLSFLWKTRENVVVLEFLAVDNFDFTRKIVKKNLGEKLVRMLGFLVKIEFLDKKWRFPTVWKPEKTEELSRVFWLFCDTTAHCLKAAENRARQTHPRLSKRWKNRLEARQEPDLQHVADVKVENFEDLAKDQELVLSVSLAGQLDLTNKLSVEGSI